MQWFQWTLARMAVMGQCHMWCPSRWLHSEFSVRGSMLITAIPHCTVIWFIAMGFHPCGNQSVLSALQTDRNRTLLSERGRGMISLGRCQTDQKACPLLPSSVGYGKMPCVTSFKKCSKRWDGPSKKDHKRAIAFGKRTLKQNATTSNPRNDQIVLSHSSS